jgi:hypothetical protein
LNHENKKRPFYPLSYYHECRVICLVKGAR